MFIVHVVYTIRKSIMGTGIYKLDRCYKTSVLSETINGKRPVSLNVAVALEKALGIPVELWMNLQSQYNMDTANIAERTIRKETISVTIPVSDHNLFKELAHKLGWACML